MEFSFVPLQEADLPLLAEWVRRPHVAAWWEEPCGVEALREEYFPRVAQGAPAQAFIAWQGGRAIGFIQWYRVMGCGGGWWEGETDPGARGIDQFLAHEEDLGRGIGSAMVRAFIDGLFEDAGVSRVQTDPAPRNERAIRAYRKAGFVDRGIVQTPDGPSLLMLRLR